MNLTLLERLTIALITTLVFGILGFISIQQEGQKISKRNQETAHSIGLRAASNLALPVYNVDFELTQRILTTEFAVEELNALIILETDGNVFAGLERNGLDIENIRKNTFNFSRPSYAQSLSFNQGDQNMELGQVKVFLNDQVGQRQLRDFTYQVLLSLALADVVLLALIYFFMNKMAMTTKRAQAAHLVARTSQQQMRAIIEGSKDLIAAVDPRHRLIAYNTAFAAHIKRHYQHDVHQGDDFTAVVRSSSDTESLVQRDSWTRTLSGDSFLSTYAIQAADPSETSYWEASFSPIIDDDGYLLGALCLNRHVTETVKNQEELKHRAEDLEKSNTMLENFAFIASHDLKEPLRKIRMQSQILLEEHNTQLSNDGIKFLRNIQDASLRMTQLISSVLSVAMIKQQKVLVEQVDIQKLVQKHYDALVSEPTKASFKIQFENLPVIVTNEGLISSLFQNLVENALKYSRAELTVVTIRYLSEETHHHFSVSDNGIGISREYFSKIFEIFQRLHSKSEFPGSGVGLAMCQIIVERLGGRIWVESEMGRGSTFHFTLSKKLTKKMQLSEETAA